MNIIVCAKQVPDMSEAKMDRETNTIIREGVSSIINPYDIHAIEEALRLKESTGGSVTILSMGIPDVAKMLRCILAMGADRAVLLTDRAFAGSDTLATSFALSKAVEKIGNFDLIMCGKQTIDGDTAQVGPEMAEKLGIPHVTNVVDITETDEEFIVCKKAIEKGWEVVRVSLPALITVEKDINTPRFPTIKGIRNMSNSEIKVWSSRDINADPGRIGLKGSPTQVVRTFIPPVKAAAETITGTPEEQAEKLISILNGMHIHIGNDKG
jgi:electron transfer flavoprotein beta subunit